MAKHRVFLILYIGLLCSINLVLGEDYAPDPSLEEIKKMDAQEGLDRESLQCKDPTPVNGSIKVISCNPFHLYCKVDVLCDTGFHFPDGTTSTNVTCLPFPNPCMCMAGWQTSVIPDLTCQPINYIPQKDEDFYAGADSKTDIRQDADREEENPDLSSDKRSLNRDKGASKIYQTIYGSQNKDLDKRDTEVEVNDEATYETIKTEEYTNGQEQEMEQRIGEVEEVKEELEEQVEKAGENQIEIILPETGVAIELIEPSDIEIGEEINENIEEQDLNIELNEEELEVVEEDGDEESVTGNQGLEIEENPEETEVMNNAQETTNEEISETDETENETEESEYRKFEEGEQETNNKDTNRGIKTHFTDVDSNIHVPEYLTEYNTNKDSESIAANIPPEHADPACYLPPKTGFCKAAFRRYYFNSQTKECEIFTYGGCGGNDNNFKTIEDCQQICSNTLV